MDIAAASLTRSPKGDENSCCVSRLRTTGARLRSSARAQSLVEAVAGIMIMVPLALALLDLSVYVIGGNICNNLAKEAARAAANSGTRGDAVNSLTQTKKLFAASTMYPNIDLQLSRYDQGAGGAAQYGGQTTVVAVVTVKMPVAVPLLGVPNTMQIQTQSSEPLLAAIPTP